jgi:unsaturated rhamnogalacturonyl hydrolase
MHFKRLVPAALFFATFASFATLRAVAEDRPWSQKMADSAMSRWPDGRFVPPGARWAWNYELGTLLEGMESVWLNTSDPRCYNYIKASVDSFLAPDGSIPTWKPEENQLDSILMGRQLLLLYGVTLDKRYATAATALYQQLQRQPRTPAGGFWHKQRYPNQMWLDGLYMAEPFYAEYAATFRHPEAFSDITRQFELVGQHMRDPATGLLYHGWDESRKERWADKQTGLSSEFWARAMGWHMMALVDTLAYYPESEPGRKVLLDELERDVAAVVRQQDGASGLWFQVLNKPTEKGNFLESSASCMFVYALARGVREGYLPPSYLASAQRGYKGIQGHFVQTNSDATVSLSGTVKAAGLGGDPYRDGSYAYYIGEKVITDDPKGVGAFLLASTEMENAQNAALGRGKAVLLDAWLNSQTRPDAFGVPASFHYKWSDQSNSGYSLFGHIFNNFGAKTRTLSAAATVENLSRAQVYIIVSPDNPAKNPTPHYMNPEEAAQIEAWVRAGGVLVLMENDPVNADLDHLNLLTDRFGIHYNNVLRNQVTGNQFEMGKVAIEAGGPIFHQPHTAYMKEICTITATGPAKSLLIDHGDILMASAKIGKGTVFATVDPWLYNEYTDGRKLPTSYDNYAAGQELVRWVLDQVPPQNAPVKDVSPAQPKLDPRKDTAMNPATPATPAPTSEPPKSLPVVVFQGEDLARQIAQFVGPASQKGSSGGTIAKSGNLALMISVRTTSGGAEVHAHFDDLMIVQQGSATLVTGGTVVEAKTSGNGETHGTRIEGGQSQQIKAGDVLIIPAGVPHQLLIPAGTTYSALVAKVQE